MTAFSPDTPHTDLQLFNLGGYMSALGILPGATEQQVRSELSNAETNIQALLDQGFYAWIDENGNGVQGTFATGNGVNFMISKILFGAVTANTTIKGEYEISGQKVTVIIDKEANSPILTSKVLINDKLVAERANPFSFAQQHTQANIRMNEIRTGDPTRLDKALQPDRNPIPFALKMLRDLREAKFDDKKTQAISTEMKEEHIVRWAIYYAVKETA